MNIPPPPPLPLHHTSSSATAPSRAANNQPPITTFLRLPNTIPVPEWAKPQQAAQASSSCQQVTSLPPPLPPPGSAIRCLCGSGTSGVSFLQCKGRHCGVFQHCDCIGQSYLVQGKRPYETWCHGFTSGFLCERCRIELVDPFYELVSELLSPGLMRRTSKSILVGATNQPQIHIDRTITLSPQQQLGLRNGTFQLRVYSLCLTDTVPNRWCWPTGTSLRVNGLEVRTNNRQPHVKLGSNGRDDAVDVSAYCATSSKIVIACTAGDARQPFCLGARLTAKRSIEAVRSLMMPPPTIQESMARICSHLASSSDEVQICSGKISLKDPMTGLRMIRAARFSNSSSVSSFDLATFLDIARRTRKWQCPFTLIDSSISHLVIDAFMQAILDSLGPSSDVTEIEIDPTGKWRPAGSHIEYLYPGQPYVSQALEPNAGDDDEEEEDEFESLRQAARAFKQAMNPGKRKREEEVPEVIVID